MHMSMLKSIFGGGQLHQYMYLLRTSLGQFPVGSPRNVLLLLLLSANQYETNALSNWLPNYSIEKICVQMSNDARIVSVQEYNLSC